MVVDVCVFFFKQKTAYEMRISDWSSDVCSSDLLGKSDVVTGSGIFGPGIAEADNETQVCHRGQMPTAPANGRRSSGGLLLLGDRKSVVSGKSVSLRVDPGVRRSIKKKKKYITEQSIIYNKNTEST